MKKLCILLLLLTVSFVLISCGDNNTQAESQTGENDPGAVSPESLPNITIGLELDPWDFFPEMSSRFPGVKLIVSTEMDYQTLIYKTDKGSFFFYENDKILVQGNQVSTDKNIWWWPLAGEIYTDDWKNLGYITITVDAVDNDNRILATGFTTIKQDHVNEIMCRFSAQEIR